MNNDELIRDDEFIHIEGILEEERETEQRRFNKLLAATSMAVSLMGDMPIYDIRLTTPTSSNSGARNAFVVRENIGVRTEPKVGRNDLCPCDSGKKYKHCCLNSIPS